MAPGALSDFSGLLPDAVRATAVLLVGVGTGHARARHGPRGARLVLRLPRPALARVGARAPARDAGLRVHAVRARRSTCLGRRLPLRSPAARSRCSRSCSTRTSTCWRARPSSRRSRELVEAARGLGLSRARAILRVALPLARPAILGGVALALMESLADFGTVNLLGVQTFTERDLQGLVRRVRPRRRAAARHAAGVDHADAAGARARSPRPGALRAARCAAARSCAPVRLRGAGGRGRAGPARSLLVGVVVAAPLVQLAVWSVRSISDGLLPPEFAAAARNSLMLAGDVARARVGWRCCSPTGARSAGSRSPAAAVRTATIGYGLPGSVVAVAVIVPLGWIDHRLDDVAGVGLLLTGTVIGLFAAYTVRFLALAFQLGRRRPAAGAALARRGGSRAGLRPPGRARARARADDRRACSLRRCWCSPRS